MFTQKLVYRCPQQLYLQNPQREDKQLHCSSQGKTTQQWKGRNYGHRWQARCISRESFWVRKANFNTLCTIQFHLGNVVDIPNSNNRKQINNCQWLRRLLFSHSIVSYSLRPTPWTAARQASLSFSISQSLLKLMFIESVMPFILCCPLFLLPSIFPSIRCFPMNQLFALGGQSTSASASVLSMNIQCWLTLENYLCRQSNVSAF